MHKTQAMTETDLTASQYAEVIDRCRAVFLAKARDYGPSWRVLRLPSVTDQLFIKARRIRSIEEKAEQRVPDSVESEWVGIVNYGVIALWLWEAEQGQRPLPEDATPEDELASAYDAVADGVFRLMLAKNHDYGEAWREMRPSSMTDLVLVKLLRIKQLEDLGGRGAVSEGVDANYADIVNYAVFALILLKVQ